MVSIKGRGELTEEELKRRAIIAENLKDLKEKRGITQTVLSTRTGIPQNTLSRYLNGKSTPKDIYLQKLADFFKVDISTIDPPQPQPLFIPHDGLSDPELEAVLTLHKTLGAERHGIWIDYGNSLLAEQNKQTDVEEELFDYDYYDQAVSAGTGQYLGDVRKETISLPINVDADFVVPIYGDSMEPDFHSGDYAFVKLTLSLEDGDIGVFYLDNDAYIKQVFIKKDHALLHSLNQNGNYPDIRVDADSDIRVIGKVVDVYKN